MKNILPFLILQLLALQAFSQITGKIVDESNQAMIGVTVLVEGTANGTTTDIDGKFSIDVNKGQNLVISFIGYETINQQVTNNNEIFITMQTQSIAIDEVVVMGYSSKTKTEISSAVTVLSSEQLNDIPATDVATLLQGKVSGVQVVNSSGEPGSSAEIRIRGISTIKPGNAEPLFVVDGIIGGAFDPDDVESITVLKDAGATGLYGARANKGVIIVTTKKAKQGKTTLEFKTSYGYNVVDHGNIQMMSGAEFYNDFSAELYRDFESHEIDKIKFFKDYPQELEGRDYSWVDQIFQPSPIQKYHLAASGRKDKFGYYLSGTYYDEKGTYKSTGYKKINLRANTDFQIGKKVKLRNNINISSSKGTTYDYLDLYSSYLGIPWDNPFNADNTTRYVDGRVHDWWSRDNINPFHSIENSDYNYKGVAINYDLSLDIQLTDWLSFTTNNRLNFATNKGHRFVSPVAAGTFHGKGSISESQDLWFGAISTNLFKLNKDFGKHAVSGLLGVEFDQGFYENLSVDGKGLPEGFSVPTVASSEFNISGANSKEVFRSFISQVNYNFDRTYFLTASFRIDESSNFPPNSRTAYFPSIAASWMINRMPFMQSAEAISLLKLRASFGITGDPDIGASRYLGLYSLNTQYNGSPSATPFQLANPDLTWEKTNQYNLGFDIGLFKDRLNFNLDLYNNVTKDLLVLASQPLSQGFEFRWENSGSVTNRGFEVAISTVNIKSNNFTWTTDFNFAMNSNELSGIEKPFFTTINSISQIYRNDNPIYTFVLPKWLGVDSETGAPLWEKIEKDASGNIVSRTPTSIYTEADPQEVGNALPKFSGGLNTTLQYKNISLSASLAYQYGNDIYNFTRIFMDNDGHEPYYNNLKPKSDWSRWKQPGDNATHPSFQNNTLSKEASSRYLEDGSFIKLRNVSLNYRLPNKLVSKMKLQQVSVGLIANNLLTLTKFWGQDPEVTLNQLSFAMPGVSDFKYPNNKRFLFNLSVKF